MEAVGIYLDRLAMLRGLKVKAVATQAGVKPGYISRLISHDIKEPSAKILRALTDAVGGNWEDVGALLDARAGRPQEQRGWRFTSTARPGGNNKDSTGIAILYSKALLCPLS